MFRALLLAVALAMMTPLASQAQSGRWPAERASAEHGSQRQGNAGRQREAGRGGDYDRRNTMSPDERRELNRDLQRANREIYRKGKERPQRQ